MMYLLKCFFIDKFLPSVNYNTPFVSVTAVRQMNFPKAPMSAFIGSEAASITTTEVFSVMDNMLPNTIRYSGKSFGAAHLLIVFSNCPIEFGFTKKPARTGYKHRFTDALLQLKRTD
jgi:hypothetical protein